MQVVPQVLFATTGFGGGAAGAENAVLTTPALVVPRDGCFAVVSASLDLTLNAGVTTCAFNIRRGSSVGTLLNNAQQLGGITTSVPLRFSITCMDTLINQGTVQYTMCCNPTGGTVGTYIALTMSVMLFF